MRILLAPNGSRGDVQPLLSLGTELLSAGHEVSMCGPPSFQQEAEAIGLAYHPLAHDAEAFARQHASEATAGARRSIRSFREHLTESIPAQFTGVMEASEEAEVIVAAGMQLAAGSVAEARKIPYHYLVYCPALLVSRAHPPLVVATQWLPRFMNPLLWRITLSQYNKLVLPLANAHRARLDLPALDNIYHNFMSAEPIVATDDLLASVPKDTPFLATYQPGYLHPPAPKPLPAEVQDFLASGPKPVYIGFGSMVDAAPEQTGEMILEAIRLAGCRAVVLRGWAGLAPSSEQGDLLVVDNISHQLLFPRMAAAVHHGGAGTTAAAALAGVPQVLVPHLVDQFYWGSRVYELGLGPKQIRRNKITARSLAAALTRVTTDTAMIERASTLGEQLRQRTPLHTTAGLVTRAVGTPVL